MPKFNPLKSPNASILQDIQSKAAATANARATIDLDINLIDENPNNSDIFNMDEEDLKRLANTIEKEGFYGVVEVYKKPDGRYELSSGHRRTRAAKSIGWKTVPAIVLDMPEDETVVRKKLIFSNINSRNMTPMDWARAIDFHKNTIQMEYGIDGVNKKRDKSINIMQMISDDFGMSENTLHCYMRLNNLIPTLQEYVADGFVPFRAMSELARENKDVQEELAIQIERMLRLRREAGGEKTALTVSQIDGIINNIKREKEAADWQEQKVVKSPMKLEPVVVEQVIEKIEEERLDSSDVEFDIPVNEMAVTTLYDNKLNDDRRDVEEREEKTSSYVTAIDRKVHVFVNDFERLMETEYRVEDKDTVEKDLQAIELVISMIRDRMK